MLTIGSAFSIVVGVAAEYEYDWVEHVEGKINGNGMCCVYARSYFGMVLCATVCLWAELYS